MIVGVAALLAACSSGSGASSGTSTSNTIGSVAPATTPSSSVSSELAETSPPGSGTPSPTSTVLPPFEPDPIEWEQFNEAVDVGTLEVPVDYADPDGPRFDLFLARYNALNQEEKIGTLLVNPGGPGYGGSDLALTAAARFDRPLRERFDIIGWDPRGTGESDPPIDCIDNYDEYFAGDAAPQTSESREAVLATAQRFGEQCQTNSGDILHFVGTNASARDMDVIRRALGEEQISYFGFSYGSELGAVWATLFPDTVRAMVLDGAADPDADPLESSLEQLRGFEASLTAFLADCSERESCAFHNRGDAEGAFDALMEQLDAAPIVGAPERPPVNRAMATVGVVMAMYTDALWPALAESLAAAQEGDGGGLLELYDTYYERRPDGTWGNELEAFRVISCVDRDDRRTVEEIDAQIEQMHEVAPRLVPAGAVGGYMCAFLPPSTDPRIEITGAGAGPVVVIGTTGDPSTPLESTRRMAETLEDGRLVVVEANQHTGYGVNRCIVELVNRYLIDLEAPDHDTPCA